MAGKGYFKARGISEERERGKRLSFSKLAARKVSQVWYREIQLSCSA